MMESPHDLRRGHLREPIQQPEISADRTPAQLRGFRASWAYTVELRKRRRAAAAVANLPHRSPSRCTNPRLWVAETRSAHCRQKTYKQSKRWLITIRCRFFKAIRGIQSTALTVRYLIKSNLRGTIHVIPPFSNVDMLSYSVISNKSKLNIPLSIAFW